MKSIGSADAVSPNNAVLYNWHAEHCVDPIIYEDSVEHFLVCSTCGRYIQHPQNKEQKPVSH